MPSAVIRSYEYSAARRELRVTFQSGRSYIYQNVPEDTYRAMRRTLSKGSFFNEHIRDRFPYVRAEPG